MVRVRRKRNFANPERFAGTQSTQRASPTQGSSLTRRSRRASPHRGPGGIAAARLFVLALIRLRRGARLSVSAPLRWLDCGGAHGLSGMRPQHFLSALSALFHLFKCITHSASRQDSSGKRPQTFLRALCALGALFKCITNSARLTFFFNRACFIASCGLYLWTFVLGS